MRIISEQACSQFVEGGRNRHHMLRVQNLQIRPSFDILISLQMTIILDLYKGRISSIFYVIDSALSSSFVEPLI
jgi:hypothetical protein